MIVVFILLTVSIYFQNNKIDNFKITNKEVVDKDIKSNIDDYDMSTKNDENKVDEIVGKIKIGGTNINEKIVQGSDNQYYLNHSIDKKESVEGSIFLDYRNKKYDRKILIYGHNSKTLNNLPFHNLEKYLNYNYYKNHKYIDLELFGKKEKWEIFSVMVVEGNYHMKITFNDIEYQKHIDWILNNSIYTTGIDVSIKDKILTLQTCYYEPEDSYLLVNAKKI